ncbi:DNA replication complex GINS protein SLD5 [Chrysoperla carnea]|uniref:DNA replication complex GINS protein SLD5 n=1 Tax=Chrysoperla carnea TaxID=189513 RepID=UPI001D089487|nr:DNA replication complex GINS protein SLD5 [Chrysoperla carnea]
MDDSTFDEFLTNESVEEELTAGEVLKEIEEAWLNERFAPEILPNRTDLVECMLGQLHHMENNLKKLKKNELIAVIHKMEIDRIRFIITSYMRTRLEKIELFTKHILDAEKDRIESNVLQYLSPEEYTFAQEFLTHEETLFQNNGMRHMLGSAQQMDWKETLIKPNLNTHVFLKVKEDVQGLVIGSEIMDLEKDSQHVVSYNPVANLLKNGKIRLI